jgi:hypothetical protein
LKSIHHHDVLFNIISVWSLREAVVLVLMVDALEQAVIDLCIPSKKVSSIELIIQLCDADRKNIVQFVSLMSNLSLPNPQRTGVVDNAPLIVRDLIQRPANIPVLLENNIFSKLSSYLVESNLSQRSRTALLEALYNLSVVAQKSQIPHLPNLVNNLVDFFLSRSSPGGSCVLLLYQLFQLSYYREIVRGNDKAKKEEFYVELTSLLEISTINDNILESVYGVVMHLTRDAATMSTMFSFSWLLPKLLLGMRVQSIGTNRRKYLLIALMNFSSDSKNSPVMVNMDGLLGFVVKSSREFKGTVRQCAISVLLNLSLPDTGDCRYHLARYPDLLQSLVRAASAVETKTRGHAIGALCNLSADRNNLDALFASSGITEVLLQGMKLGDEPRGLVVFHDSLADLSRLIQADCARALSSLSCTSSPSDMQTFSATPGLVSCLYHTACSTGRGSIRTDCLLSLCRISEFASGNGWQYSSPEEWYGLYSDLHLLTDVSTHSRTDTELLQRISSGAVAFNQSGLDVLSSVPPLSAEPKVSSGRATQSKSKSSKYQHKHKHGSKKHSSNSLIG